MQSSQKLSINIWFQGKTNTIERSFAPQIETLISVFLLGGSIVLYRVRFRTSFFWKWPGKQKKQWRKQRKDLWDEPTSSISSSFAKEYERRLYFAWKSRSPFIYALFTRSFYSFGSTFLPFHWTQTKGERKNLILPSFITRKETKPSSLASRPSFGEKFKFGFYYLSFFEYGETTSTVLASKKLFGRSLLSYSQHFPGLLA